ncbi:DUF2262 domain-containing protein, partial [Dysosmobacter welbionis]
RLDQAGGLFHLLQTDVHGAGDIDEHALGPLDGGLQQGAGNGHLGGLLGLALAGGPTHAHVGHAGVLHDGGDVREVQVDEAGIPDQVGDGLHRLAQHVVRDLEGVCKGDLLVRGVLQPLVGDDDQGVHLVLQLRDAGLCLLHPPAALKPEGLGDHRHGEDVHLLGDLRHDGGAASAGTAAHASSDEHHIRVLQCLGDLAAALLRALAAHLGVGSGALTVGQLFADLDLIGGAGYVQRLLVGIDRHKVHALGAAADHAVDHIVAAAAHADDLDIDNGIGTGL